MSQLTAEDLEFLARLLTDPDRAAGLAELLAEDQVRIVIQPGTVHRYTY